MSDSWKSNRAREEAEHHCAPSSSPIPPSSQLPSGPSLLAWHVNAKVPPLTSHEHLPPCWHGTWHLSLKLHSRLELFSCFQNVNISQLFYFSSDLATITIIKNKQTITQTSSRFTDFHFLLLNVIWKAQMKSSISAPRLCSRDVGDVLRARNALWKQF